MSDDKDWLDRVSEERKELLVKMEKLSTFIANEDIPLRTRNVLRLQYRAMSMYEGVLHMRLIEEGREN